MALDFRIFPFTFLISLVAAVIFGLAPALRFSKGDQATALKRGPVGRGNFLVMAQVALSCLLLIGGGLFLRSMQFAQSTDPGFDRTGIMMFSVDLELQGYDQNRGQQFERNLTERLRAVPGVSAAGVAFPLPLDAYQSSSEVIPEGYVPRANENRSAGRSRVGSGYFETMGTRLVAGRAIDERDTDQKPLVAVVNETLARRYWRTPRTGSRPQVHDEPKGPPIEVIGVARNGKYITFGEGATPYYFVPLAQDYQGRITVLVRSHENASALLASIRQQVHAVDPALPIFGVRSMPQFLSRTVSNYQGIASLLGTFALVALLLAVIGIYGVLHFTVARRTREIGIRMALGAQRSQVVRLVLQRSLLYVGVGACLGAGMALAVARFTGTLLAGVTGSDPLTFCGVLLLFGCVALIASIVPARRAIRVDPIQALRWE